jgi:uncharacterized protein
MNAEDYDPLFVEGVEYFNRCDFFEAHESWEHLWTDYQGPSRKFYQGLIQVAVCLHHFGNGNLRGARKLYQSSRGYLQEYRPFYEGVDLEKLFAQLEVCCAPMLDESVAKLEIVPDDIPEIHLNPPAAYKPVLAEPEDD